MKIPFLEAREKKGWSGDDMKSFTASRVDKMIDSKMGHRDSSQLIAYIEQLSPSSVLEVGCGYGRNLLLFDSSILVTGVDFTPKMLEKGKELCRNNPNITLQEMDAKKLSFPDNAFDIVFTDTVLAHIPHTELPLAISEIKRVAKTAVILKESDTRKLSLKEKIFKKWHELYRNYGEFGFEFVAGKDFLEWRK